MRNSMIVACYLVFMLMLFVFLATGKLFHGHLGLIFRHFGWHIVGFCVCLVILIASPLCRACGGYRGLRVTGSKLKRTQKELEQDGWNVGSKRA